MSILCHIWKIVPDLYEAILNLNQQHSSSNTASTSFPQNSTESIDEMQLSSVNISDIDHHLGVNSTYGPLYYEESNDVLANILIYEGRSLNMSNCSSILKRLSEQYNVTGQSLANFINSFGLEEDGEGIVEVSFCKILLLYQEFSVSIQRIH